MVYYTHTILITFSFSEMIEKRKNNLKEEIENSEKRARKTATEEIEEEEEENIPEDNERHIQEEEINEDYENEDRKNGFLLEGDLFYY